MRIETIDLRTITETDAQAIATSFVAIWPKPGRTVETMTSSLLSQWRDYRGPDAQHPRAFVIREDGRVTAHAAAYPRVVGTAAGEMTLMALARVCTDPVARGRKLGQAVTKAALELVDNGPFPFALFQTNEQVAPFYERLGAVAVNNEFINSTADDPAFPPFWDRIIMRYPATGNWPAGQIDLCGPGW
jgi:predicted GNAT family N-acyltransferase